jgi:ATP-dependent DNA helicase RecQ
MTLPELVPPTLEDARGVLRARFGFPDFRPGQGQAIEAILAGRDTLVVLPTGGGKSLCYQVPALCIRGLTVVVSPLISLMKDQVDALVARGIEAAFINSTLSGDEVRDRLLRAQTGRLSLLYVAPERFEIPSFAERLRAIGVSLLAIDEAHCISEWGHDFRPSYMRIGEVRERLGTPPTIALTATATPTVRDDIARVLGLRDPEIVVTGFDRPNLSYGVVSTKTEAEKDATLLALLQEMGDDGTAVVYAATRKQVERISQVLDDAGIAAAAYHAGLDDARRQAVQEAFMAERARVIVATNSFGMGVDKSNVRLVVHHQMPGTLEAYYQEAGRAGRDGLPSRCILLHMFPDRRTHEFFIAGSFPERDLVRQVHRQLKVESDASGRIHATAQEIAAGIGGKVNVRGVETAMRLLQETGVLRWDPDSPGLVQVRLLATPERIKDELGSGPAVDLLRALWRMTKGAVQRGAVVDLDLLPRDLGGMETIWGELDALQARQFVVADGVGGGLRLADRGASFESLPIDWSALGRRRQRELDKLDAVQRYAYSDNCRRAILLRWFGDPAARPRCDGCDNCLGEKLHPVSASRGGAPRTRTRTGGRSSRAEAPRASGGRIGEASASRRGGTATAPARTAPTVSAEDAPLLDALKRCRTELAREQRVPAYVIFPDATLAAFASRKPTSPNAMAEIPGVGDVKLARYGTAFIAVIKTHLAG